MIAESGRQGTVTLYCLLIFHVDRWCSLVVSSIVDVAPPDADIVTVPPPAHTAEWRRVAFRRAAISFAKLVGLASMRTPRKPKQRSSKRVFESVSPSSAPSSTKRPGERLLPRAAARKSVGSNKNSSPYCECGAEKERCGARYLCIKQSTCFAA